MPISFRKLRAVMESRGVKKFDLRKAGVNSQILDKVLSDGNVDTRTIGKLCRLLRCQPGDIMEYDEDQEEQGAAHEEQEE
ncbi:MAG: helix-turn-helix transcriptional regulator [Candidatus Faecousia sp.]|nr:helix-turn-helix transcriptional regulator [Candidatus Faecousia sp.]